MKKFAFNTVEVQVAAALTIGLLMLNCSGGR